MARFSRLRRHQRRLLRLRQSGLVCRQRFVGRCARLICERGIDYALAGREVLPVGFPDLGLIARGDGVDERSVLVGILQARHPLDADVEHHHRDLSDQRMPHFAERSIAARIADRSVEPEVCPESVGEGERLHVSAAKHLESIEQQGFDFRRPESSNSARCGYLEGEPDLLKLPCLLSCEPSDVGALVGDGDEHSFLFEFSECFAQRSAADPDLSGHLHLVYALSRDQSARQQLVTDDRQCLDSQRSRGGIDLHVRSLYPN